MPEFKREGPNELGRRPLQPKEKYKTLFLWGFWSSKHHETSEYGKSFLDTPSVKFSAKFWGYRWGHVWIFGLNVPLALLIDS